MDKQKSRLVGVADQAHIVRIVFCRTDRPRLVSLQAPAAELVSAHAEYLETSECLWFSGDSVIWPLPMWDYGLCDSLSL